MVDTKATLDEKVCVSCTNSDATIQSDGVSIVVGSASHLLIYLAVGFILLFIAGIAFFYFRTKGKEDRGELIDKQNQHQQLVDEEEEDH